MSPAESPALTNMLTDLSSRRRRNARRFEKKGKKLLTGNELEEAEYARSAFVSN